VEGEKWQQVLGSVADDLSSNGVPGQVESARGTCTVKRNLPLCIRNTIPQGGNIVPSNSVI